METYIQGLVLQSSLILALGAQNLFVLDCGIHKRSPVAVALVCALCDALLILLGVLGAATLFQMVPFFQLALSAAGVFFLVFYGARKLREGFGTSSLAEMKSTSSGTLKATLIAALSFSLLNPHVYLDTLVLIGGYSSRFPVASDRLAFGAGAASFSFVWFFALSLGAAAISLKLRSPKVLRRISLVSGCILIALGLKLAWESSHLLGLPMAVAANAVGK